MAGLASARPAISAFAKHPKASFFQNIDGKRKVVEELLWGDLVNVQDEVDGDFVRVKIRPHDARAFRVEGWMKRDDLIDKPLLEITFVDIGQGDGCVVVTPDQRFIVIDAGEGDNMSRFLHWRLDRPSGKRPKKLEAVVISHPDADHYRGFENFFYFDEERKKKGTVYQFPKGSVSIDCVYHNGLVERKATPMLGPKTSGKPAIYTDLVDSAAHLRRVLKQDADANSGKKYPKLLRAALQDGTFTKFQMLCRKNGFMPGFEADKKISVQVLGPVIESDDDGNTGLRRLGNDGLTKNGHSVVLRLTFGNTRVLLGGDLNIPSEELLLETLLDRPLPKAPRKTNDQRKDEAAHEEYVEAMREAVEDARELIEVDVAKSCHHGSADFSSLFLEALHPVATVISSGDDEPHSHPRAETLGAIGRASRGARPLIYSTELARSATDKIKDARREQRDMSKAHRDVLSAKDTKTRKKADADFRKLLEKTVQRSVQMYGAIYLRTDGERAVIGQRFERRGSGGTWDLCELDPGADGKLAYTSKHAKH